jgi:transcriptional regulator with XRE-family HTH domain
MGSNTTPATKKLRAALILKGITQWQIAKIIGVSQSSIDRTLRGERGNPRLRAKISRLLGIPLGIWKDLDAELRSVQEETRR